MDAFACSPCRYVHDLSCMRVSGRRTVGIRFCRKENYIDICFSSLISMVYRKVERPWSRISWPEPLLRNGSAKVKAVKCTMKFLRRGMSWKISDVFLW